MKKYNLVILSALLLSDLQIANAKTSDSAKKFCVTRNIGAGVPMGAFSETNSARVLSPLNSSPAPLCGYTTMGMSIDGSITYKVISCLNAMLFIGSNVNYFNISNYNSQFVAQNPEPFWGFGYSGVTSGGAYCIGKYLIGPSINCPIGKFDVQLKALGGLATASYPTLIYNTVYVGEITDNPGTETFAMKTGCGLAYNLGASLRYHPEGESITLNLNMDYFGSDIIYPGYTRTNNSITPGSGTTTQTVSQSMTMPVSILEASLGVSFAF